MILLGGFNKLVESQGFFTFYFCNTGKTHGFYTVCYNKRQKSIGFLTFEIKNVRKLI